MGLSKVYDWWIDRRWADIVVSCLVVGSYGFIVWKTGRFDVLSWLAPGDRRGLYSAFAVVVSLTGALSGVAVSQLAAAKGPRAKALKQQGGAELAKTWRSIYAGAMGSALLALVALGLDSTTQIPIGHNAVVAKWSFLFGLSVGILKFARLTAIFQPVISMTVRDDVEPAEEDAPAPTLDIDAYQRATDSR